MRDFHASKRAAAELAYIARVVSHVILDNSPHCKGGADIEVNVCATPGPIGKS